jgi:hypothetical protein
MKKNNTTKKPPLEPVLDLQGQAHAGKEIQEKEQSQTTFIEKPSEYVPTKQLIVDVELLELYDRHIYWLTMASGERVALPSVTTQLSALSNDFIPRLRGDIGNREADMRMNEAANSGKRIHYAAYTYATGGVVLYDYPVEVNVNKEHKERIEKIIEQCKVQGVRYYLLYDQEEYMKFRKYKTWMDIVNPIVHHAEVTVGSISELAAGTIDAIIEIKETKDHYDIAGAKKVNIPAGYYIFDLKNGFYDKVSAQCQTAEYMVLAEKNLGISFSGTIICHTKAMTGGKYPGLTTYLTHRDEALKYAEHFKYIQKTWLLQNPNWEPEVELFEPVSMRKEVESALMGGQVLELKEEAK